MSQVKTNTFRNALSLFISALLVLAAVLLYINRQYAIDQVSAWQYEPDARIAKVVRDTGMTDKGKFYFYASQPSIEERDSFNNKCQRKEQTSAILGCYAGGQIYIFNVKDQRLQGMIEVTAAHEMLHAAYDRLSEDQKQTLGKLLEKEYKEVASVDLEERMQYYDRNQAGERRNELHSIVGTEFADLSPELEKHYSTFFTNRNKVVELHKNYKEVFDDLKQRSEAIASEMNSLATSIDTRTEQYNNSVHNLNQVIERFNARAERGDFENQAEFERERASITAVLASLENEKQIIDSEIQRYEALRKELEIVAGQSEELNRSLDSNLVPVPSV